jgi:hypothetical protein
VADLLADRAGGWARQYVDALGAKKKRESLKSEDACTKSARLNLANET